MKFRQKVVLHTVPVDFHTWSKTLQSLGLRNPISSSSVDQTIHMS